MSLKFFRTLNFTDYWELILLDTDACSTLLDRLSLLSFLCLLAGERSKFLIRLVNPSPGMMFVGTPGRKKSRRILGAAAEPPAHTASILSDGAPAVRTCGH